MNGGTHVVVGFAMLLAIALALTALAHMRRDLLTPLSAVAAAALTSRPVRIIAVLCWAWLGWHFLAR
ncbi:hypothetical protein SAMN04244553_3367 [Nocardia amikacinitolerans]|uniref:Uncharacterized protein n=1 Tax=Nocardia amikacinitolerans TaxID=756689 RepID=A0A285LAI2_9NOCA|nr:DUF6186 family protein [Nocardia amikacinitolerans]MCP2297502.1 hypothetical protein [Nocardia amikacinitolerans]SNY81874.1 hypothetical protein SAMN04244553_3367 [Nocardia amikacinitolerans]